MKAHKQFFIVKIDKKAQQAKREKTSSGIYLSQQFLFMKYNLQHGEIVSIGERATQDFPDAKIGDTLFFSHIVESQEWRILKETDDFEWRGVDVLSGTEVLGVYSDKFIPNKNFIFMEQHQEPAFRKAFSSSIFFVDAAMFEDDDYLQRKIEDLRLQRDELKDTVACERDPYQFEIKYNLQQKIANEGKKLSQFMHRERFCKCKVSHVNPETTEETGIEPGNFIFMDSKILYELEAMGNKFYYVPTEFVAGILV